MTYFQFYASKSQEAQERIERAAARRERGGTCYQVAYSIAQREVERELRSEYAANRQLAR
jgi:aryl-alcohol dehydrogenase-like predicted oxidoreductase